MALGLNRRQYVLHGIGALAGATAWAQSSSARRPLRLAVSDNYAPLYMLDNGRASGLVVDILRTVLQRQMGLMVEIDPFPWARAQMLVQRGEYDALCTIPTPERLQYTVASAEAVLVNNFRLFVHRDNPLLPQLRQVRSLPELLALKPSAVSYSGSGWSKANLSSIGVVLTGTFDNVMRLLLARRADIVIDGEVNVMHWLATHPEDLGRFNTADIIMLPLVYEATHFALLVAKDSPHVGLLPEFNVRMKAFRASAEYRQILQAYGVHLLGTER